MRSFIISFRRTGWVFVSGLLTILVIAGCSTSETDVNDTYDVRGRIVKIEDLTPVDGGITIYLHSDEGEAQILYMTSLYTFPPPDDDHIALYEAIKGLEPGHRVGAHGVKEGDRFILTDIERI